MATKVRRACERCNERPASKLFFIFSGPAQTIETSSNVCDECLRETGLVEGDPNFVEIFDLVRIDAVRAQWAEDAEARQFVS
jgi:hypothetical protein